MSNLHPSRKLDNPDEPDRPLRFPTERIRRTYPLPKKPGGGLFKHGEPADGGKSHFCQRTDLFCSWCDASGRADCDRALRPAEKRWELVLLRPDGFHSLVLPGQLALPAVLRQLRKAERSGANLVRIDRQTVQP